MHDIGVMLAGDNVACPTHICSKLINFIKSSIDRLPTNDRVA